MRLVDKRSKLNRRAFLGQSAGVALIAGAVGPLASRSAYALPLKGASGEDARTLVKMVRDLYPHDRLPDSFYEAAITTIDAKLAGEAAGKTLLADGAAALNKAAQAAHGKPYGAIAEEDKRIALLKGIETNPFFKRVRAEMIVALYNQPEVWTRLGYEGSSAEHGGYIHRGFNDIDWLPA